MCLLGQALLYYSPAVSNWCDIFILCSKLSPSSTWGYFPSIFFDQVGATTCFFLWGGKTMYGFPPITSICSPLLVIPEEFVLFCTFSLNFLSCGQCHALAVLQIIYVVFLCVCKFNACFARTFVHCIFWIFKVNGKHLRLPNLWLWYAPIPKKERIQVYVVRVDPGRRKPREESRRRLTVKQWLTFPDCRKAQRRKILLSGEGLPGRFRWPFSPIFFLKQTHGRKRPDLDHPQNWSIFPTNHAFA